MEKRTHIAYGGISHGFPTASVSDAVAFIAIDKYVEMFLDDGRSFLLPTVKENSIKALSAEFADEFTMVKRGSLVRLSEVTGYALGVYMPRVIVKGMVKHIAVSRRLRKSIKQKLTEQIQQVRLHSQ